ncbi:unnamed protein product [Didymodactylos carnosus]|uniref:Tetratricopeptide repeat protein n=1 Tax=Didymodactylos carnosus TaxID=1234261 RepID=A0A8S2VKK6_9BILA|nr:unnamed protein product [Didymodactylos carnosus]
MLHIFTNSDLIEKAKLFNHEEFNKILSFFVKDCINPENILNRNYKSVVNYELLFFLDSLQINADDVDDELINNFYNNNIESILTKHNIVENHPKGIQLPEEDDAIIAYESELHFYIKQAEYYLQNNNEDAAMENYNKVLELAGDKTDYGKILYHQKQGDDYYEKENYSAAIEHYTYVLELIPDSNPSVAHYVSKLKQSLYAMVRYVYQSIGGCYRNLGEYDSAKKNFLLSLRIVLKMYLLDYKHIENLLLFIGGTYLLIKNEDAALINYQLTEQFILDIDSPMSAAQYYQLARLYFIFKRDYDLAFLELFITYVSKR